MVRFFSMSLRKCFVLTIGFAVLVIFGISVRERDIWKSRVPPTAQPQVDNNVVVVAVTTSPPNVVAPKVAPEVAPDVAANAVPNVAVSADQADDEHPQSIDGPQPLADIEAEPLVDQNYGGAANEQPFADPNDPQTTMAQRPWYFAGGRRFPVEARRGRHGGRRMAKLTPADNRWSDRITDQLMFVPPNYEEYRASGKMKTILLYNGLGAWNKVPDGRDIFIWSKCPVNTCKVTGNRNRARDADLVIYKDYVIPTGLPRPAHQLFMLYLLECPYHTQHVKFPSAINWTSTYRMDSDIVAPYEKWVYYDPRVKEIDQERNYALNKTKKVAWFVSNCGARNNRLVYANELAKHIQVDIYGACGTKTCPRSAASKCFEVLDHDYKFYLAFENSNCKEYITEKFFVNALGRNILPIVMGARPEDYAAAGPYRSYIHVDEFASPRELADYLHLLDQNDELYNSYFRWKGTGEFINTFYWCRVCALLHDEVAHNKWYEDVNKWWSGTGICTNASWRNILARKEPMKYD